MQLSVRCRGAPRRPRELRDALHWQRLEIAVSPRKKQGRGRTAARRTLVAAGVLDARMS